MKTSLRIARPVRDLELSARLYREGLGLEEIGRFADHAGFDGVMLGKRECPYHFEFTCCRHHPVEPSPTAEDLLVFYLPDEDEWSRACARMLAAGFAEKPAFNPYWNERGRTFEDTDGYRVVLENAAWPGQGRT